MDNSERVSGAEEQDNYSKGNVHTSGEVIKFYTQLSGSQAAVISKLLPLRYSLQIQREVKPKRTICKKKSNFSRKSIAEVIEPEQRSERIKKINTNYRDSEELMALNNYSRASSQAYPQEIDDSMKPCLRILQLLKSHKTSWPFREPVDIVTLGIPNYYQIIKEPMDLQTIQKNLKNRLYLTPTQFHADVKQIIKNSFEFNKYNAQFCKLTSEFQRYYNKINNDPLTRTVSDNSYQNKEIKKKSKSGKNNQYSGRDYSESQPPTLAEKKTLAGQIKKLPKEYLAEVAQIIYQGNSPSSEQVNIENLPANIVRQLQRLVKEKMAYIEMVDNNERQKQRVEEQMREEESSFDSDSDS